MLNGSKISQAVVLFGGTGDLSFRKLLPAFYNLYFNGKFTDSQHIFVLGRRPWSTEDYLQQLIPWIEKFSRFHYDEEFFNKFKKNISYVEIDFNDISNYEKLKCVLTQSEVDEYNYYFATAPRYFDTITKGIESMNLESKSKVIIEKPFGDHLTHARVLNGQLENLFSKENVYRIDHYLGKEMVRNVQAIRFSNPLFEKSWNSESIEKIEIDSFEEVGVETRGDYYDKAGVLKDMVQNHLFQILSILAMEQPTDNKPIATRQVEVLKDLRLFNKMTSPMILGQYEGYRDEDKVAKDSTTETYAKMELYIDNKRWNNVPFIIRVGKKLGQRLMKVVITYKEVDKNIPKNKLELFIQPTEGVSFSFNIKKPGDTDELSDATMEFCQSCDLSNRLNTPEAYERLLHAWLQGENTWFSQWEQIELSWQYTQALKDRYYQQGGKLIPYKEGEIL